MNTNKKEKFINKNNTVHKRFWQIGIRTFFVFLFVIAFIGLLLPLRPKESELEKRELSKFPKPTVSTMLNGEFFSDISTWYADTFPFRETLMSANAKMKKFYGITTQEIYGDAAQGDEIPDADAEMETTPTPTPEEDDIQEEDGTIHAEPERLGKIYIADNRGFELYGFSRAGADAYINMINSAATQLKDIANVYDILVPTSIAVNIDQENQQKVGSNSQEDTFAYVNGHLDASINQVAVLDTLKNHNSEYLYFKTDHHWTADGAYYAYKELMKAKGLTPSPLSDYTKSEYPGFVGSFYQYSNQSETLKNNPDTVVAYTPTCNDLTYTNTDGQQVSGYVVSDVTKYSEANKYLCFICGDQPYERIDNPSITDGSSCVVIKEILSQIETACPGKKKGIFVSNDTHASILVNLLVRKHGKLPEDYLIVGFDDSPASRNAIFPISTVAQQIDVLATEAVKLLVEQIEEHKNSKHTPVSEPIHKMITPVLIRRETTERDLLGADD